MNISTLKSAFVLLAFLCATITTETLIAQDGQVLDQIVASVDGKIILKSDVDAMVAGAMQQGQPFSDELWSLALNQIVDQKVLLSHAEQDTNIVMTDEAINGEVDQRVRQILQQAGGEDRLLELYGKSSDQIKTEIRPEVKDQLMVQSYQRMKFQGMKVTPTEVREWFHKIPTDSLPNLPTIVRVSHIVRFAEIDPVAKNEAREICETIRDSVLTSSATIEDLAHFSDDTYSAQRGGRIDNIKLSELVPEFGAVAGSLDPGQLSHVFETTFGWHVMRLNSKVGDVVDFNHILIKVDESKFLPETATDLLAQLSDSLNTHNVPLGILAKRHSQDPISAQRSGHVVDPRTFERDLSLDALDPTWKITLADLKEGELSEPRETRLLDGKKAYHIVRLDKRLEAHKVNLEQDYERIQEIVLQEKQAAEIGKWIDTLKKKSVIRQISDPGESDSGTLTTGT